MSADYGIAAACFVGPVLFFGLGWMARGVRHRRIARNRARRMVLMLWNRNGTGWETINRERQP